jgi:signal transduction histidine kinase/ligand-binding sensor domain-containing protein
MKRLGFPFLCAVFLANLISAFVYGQLNAFKHVPWPASGAASAGGINQGDDGYVWIASGSTGLWRYDGNEFKNWRNDPQNQNTIAEDRLETVYPDHEGRIWVLTWSRGLDLFDPMAGNFRHFRHDSTDPASISDDIVRAILEDHEGNIWVGTHGGLEKFDPATGKFIHYRHDSKDLLSLSCNKVRVLYEDREGILWVGTGSPFPGEYTKGDGGLNKFNRQTGKFVRYMHDSDNVQSLIDNRVRAILEDSHGNFWVGTAGDGLHRMDRQKGTFERLTYDPKSPGKLCRPPLKNDFPFSADHITFIREDSFGSLWIGTMEGGINHFDPGTNLVTHLGYSKDSTSGMQTNYYWDAFSTKDGLFWVLTWSGELYQFDPSPPQKVLTYQSGTDVYSFLAESDTVFWLGTQKGLMRRNHANGQTQLFKPRSNDQHGNRNNKDLPIFQVESDHRGKLWLRTYQKGIETFDPTTKKFISYRHDANNKSSLSNDTLSKIYIDRYGNAWATTFGLGLDFLAHNSDSFIHFHHDPKNSNSLNSDTVTSFHEDRSGNMWVATSKGLDKFNFKSLQFFHYLDNSKDSILQGDFTYYWVFYEDWMQNFWISRFNSFGNRFEWTVSKFDPKTGKFNHFAVGRNYVNSFYEDDNKNLWAATTGGLFKFDEFINQFRIVKDQSGQSIQWAINIIEDNKKNLWVSSNDGLLSFERIGNDVKLYGQEFGIYPNKISGNGEAYKNQSGELFFAIDSGYYAANPEKLLTGKRPPRVTISEFRIRNNSSVNNNLLNKTLTTEADPKLNIPNYQNIFSIGFNAIDFIDPTKNRILFMLENYDHNWNNAGMERNAYYYNIPPGEYKFRVKAVNRNQVWAEKYLTIIIDPPWWKMWWAFCLYALAIGLGIFIFDRIQRRRIISREREKSRAKELAQAREIEKAYNELKATQTQLIQSEKMASLGELTAGIAHEIQNPLNFVNNFSEVNAELIQEANKEISSGNLTNLKNIMDDLKTNMEKITNHGRRADAIVKSMLQHSRVSTGQKESADLNLLVDEYLKLSYHGFRAKDKSFEAHMQKDYDKTIGNVNIVPQDIGRALLNFYNNAFYAITEKKKQRQEAMQIAMFEGPNSELDKGSQDKYEPSVFVRTSRLDGKVEIRIRDNGNGIPKKVMDKIFQPFFTTKPPGQGTGLGLSLSYDIITKEHSGGIRVETKEGEFTEFIVEFPANRS